MSDESSDPEEGAASTYSIAFSLDNGHFFRRSCPICGRDFKTHANPADLAYALQPAFQQSGVEIGEARTGEGEAVEEHTSIRLFCPYCGHEDDASNMLTETFVEYAKRYVMREAVLPKINRMFSDLADSFNRPRASSRGWLSIEMRFEHHDSMLPPRPISGPEPPDMMLVDLLCCAKQMKVLDGWRDLIVCPYCGTKSALQ